MSGVGVGDAARMAAVAVLISVIVSGIGERRNGYHYMRGYADGLRRGVDSGVRTAMGR